MSLRVTDLASRLLAYVGLTTSDTMPTGALVWLVDAIGGAIGEMMKDAPTLFQWTRGGRLLAATTVGVTVNGSVSTTLAVATSGIIPGYGCTLRLGQTQDFTVTAYAHPVCTITPGYQGTLGSVLTAQVWHDAFAVPNIRCNDQTSVLINGRLLERVSSRERAMQLQVEWPALQPAGLTGVQRIACSASGLDTPRVWWLERDLTAGTEYVCLYPMPSVVMSIEVKGTQSVADLTTGAVLASTETFGLPEHIARDVWLPLATLRFGNCPLMTNKLTEEEITRQAKKAEETLGRVLPKPGRLPDWNERRAPGYQRAFTQGYR